MTERIGESQRSRRADERKFERTYRDNNNVRANSYMYVYIPGQVKVVDAAQLVAGVDQAAAERRAVVDHVLDN